MKLRLHHFEICCKDPFPVVQLLRDQFGLFLQGVRETQTCLQYVLSLSKTVFVVTSRNCCYLQNIQSEQFPKSKFLDSEEHWSIFCCPVDHNNNNHVDSVFNVALEVEDLDACLNHIQLLDSTKLIRGKTTVQGPEGDGIVTFAIIKSICGNVVHTILEKHNYHGWFLPGFEKVQLKSQCSHNNNEASRNKSHLPGITLSHVDHFTLACPVGDTDTIIQWYENTFSMKRFISNREDTEVDGLVIGNDVGLRLKVMEFWKCSETGLASESGNNWEPLKIVIAESLPNIRNTQIESFIKEHRGAGIQHIGLHTDNIVGTVQELAFHGVKFRHPPPTYYTEIGQLGVIESVGENVAELKTLGILLDDEADVFDDDENCHKDQYLMQVFTFPIFKEDTFFFEIIQRKGAKGFGVGNVSALARSVNAYQEMLRQAKIQTNSSDEICIQNLHI